MFGVRTATRLVAAIGAIAVVTTAGVAHADTLIADGDGVAPVAASGVAFGSNVCANTEVTKPVALAVSRNGNANGNGNNVFKNGSTVTLRVIGAPAGVTLTLPAANTITLPATWQSLDNTTMSSAITATAKLHRGLARTVSGDIKIEAAGTSTQGIAIVKEELLPVSATVVDCTPPDTTPPVLALPGNLTSEATSSAGAVVTYNATAADANPATPAVSCSSSPVAGLASGSTFPLGTTTMDCSATDAKANKATGSFTITVGDTKAPVLTSVPSDIVQEAASAQGTTVSWTAPRATDLVDGTPTIRCATPASLGSGSTFPLGTRTVTCTATDDFDNTDTKTFTVTVRDTTAPVIGDITAPDATEATSGDGATVTFTTPSATDAVDSTVEVTCATSDGLRSGSTFALGTHTVICTATDDAKNASDKRFDLVVRDTTKPLLVLPANITDAEATSPAGAKVSYTATATDIVDGEITPECNPASGSTFALTPVVTVSCAATDEARNTATGSFTVKVVDTTAPKLTEMDDLTREATSAQGAVVSFTAPTATDAVGAGPVRCASAAPESLSSLDTFPLGETEVTCSSTDGAGNTGTESFRITVEDTVAPVVTEMDDLIREATSAQGAVVTFTAPTATDAVGAGTVDCVSGSGLTSGSTFPLGETQVTCSSSDAARNTGSSKFTVTVRDSTGPALTLPGDQLLTATGINGAVANYTPRATDLVDGNVPASCTPASGSTFAIGTSTVKCTASDGAGNLSSGSFTVKVQRTMVGFYQPVDTARTLNTVKSGSTLPLKFEVFAGSTELTSPDVLAPISIKSMSCTTAAPVDEIEVLTSGSTSVRYDATAGQFVYNWKTPAQANTCYMVVVSTTDGAKKEAQFKLR